jgi:hypothetical protein
MQVLHNHIFFSNQILGVFMNSFFTWHLSTQPHQILIVEWNLDYLLKLTLFTALAAEEDFPKLSKNDTVQSGQMGS